jgi:iron complex transport system substrate-binding protein
VKSSLDMIPDLPRGGGFFSAMKTKRNISLALSLLSLLLLCAGLALGRRSSQGQAPGRVEAPDRIVSLAPSITEILFALGLEGKIVGVTEFCDYPPAAKALPKVGGFRGLNLEALLAQKPDLVLATRDGNPARDLGRISELGVRVETFQPATLEQVLEEFAAIGQETGRQPAAQELVAACRQKLDLVRSRTQGLQPVKVLFAYGRDPLVLAGQGTFADDLIRNAGGINIAGDSAIPYPRFSLEEVIARAPEVIVESAMGSEAEAAQRARESWSRWGTLPAVRDLRIAVINADLVARPGPRLFDGLILMAKILHPEAFPAEALP